MSDADKNTQRIGTHNSLQNFWQALKRVPWKKIGLGIATAAAVFFLTMLIIIWRLIAAAPSIDSIDVSPSGSATWICDEDGNYLRRLSLSESNRDIVSLEEIPDSLQNAIVAIEDSRFYEHNGIDLRGIARAFWRGITSGSFSEGASTITQQLIKNSVFTDWTQENSFADRFARKVQEQYLALQLERQLSKEEILEDYLNTINFGSGCYGVEAAAQRYFGKEVSDLTLSESAVLAAIPQNPTAYNPIEYPEANQTRQRLILRYMEEQGYISHEERMDALEDDVYLRISAYNESYEADSAYSYYEDALIDQVTEKLMSELNYSYEQATKAVYSGGLRIYSAQDAALQEICDEEFQNLSNFPEGTQYGVDYSLVIQEADGSTTTYGSEALRAWVQENYDSSFDLLCDTQEEAQSYADAFRENILNSDSIADSAIDNSAALNPDANSVDGSDTGTADIMNTSDTTVNSSNNADASGAISRSVLSERLTLSPQPQASLVLIEQETGFVRAVVGGRGEKTASLTLNRATDTTRQPGSTFKILTAYAPALDSAGQTLATLYENEPYEYEDGTSVSNWDITDYSGTVTIREAITRSINVVAVRCITEITPRLGFTYAERLGISTLVDDWDSPDGTSDVIQPLALGGITNGVTNLELCAAYATIANGGLYAEPLFFTQILDRDGTVLLDATGRSAAADAEVSTIDGESGSGATALSSQRTLGSSNRATATAISSQQTDADAASSEFDSFTRALQDSTAFLLTSAMEDVVSSEDGTAYGTVSAAGQPVAGKTGTTSSYKDIWFVGYTPYYTCCVWGGYDNNQALPDGSIWHSYSRVLWTSVMERIHTGLPTGKFTQPESVVEVTLCEETHLPAADSCSSVYTEYFAAGTEPDEICSGHETETESETESETGEITIYQDLLEELLPETETESETERKTEAEVDNTDDKGDEINDETNKESDDETATETDNDSDNIHPEKENSSSTEETSSLDDLMSRLIGEGFSIY
ncbi:MAG: transglycosylase domain-containing protein [Lachnospiraceae bacterium]|nr:transglycosylase domain-containing protein [Lachnospiraceae bacterium]